MDAAPLTYKKLPGSARRRGFVAIRAGRSRLWLGPDHLLWVESTLSTESYRRFYYSEIEAIIIRLTNRRLILNLVIAGIFLIVAGGFLLAGRQNDDAGLTAVAVIVGALGLFLILWNSLLGRRCETTIRTAVQIEKLPSLKRLRTARKALDLIEARINLRQESLAAADPEITSWEDSKATEFTAPAASLSRKNPRPRRGAQYHWIAFGLLTLQGLCGILALLRVSAPTFLVAGLAFVALVFALAVQSDTLLGLGPRRWTVLATVMEGLTLSSFTTSATFQNLRVSVDSSAAVMYLKMGSGYAQAALWMSLGAGLSGLIGLLLVTFYPRRLDSTAQT